MKPKAFVIALLTASAALPNLAHAADAAPLPSAPEIAKQWADLFVYAVTPYCQVMSNGVRVCQPMGLVGPAPTPGKAPSQPLKLVPLAPPMVQSPTAPGTPYMPTPFAGNPYVAGPYATQPGFVPPAMMPPQYLAPGFMPQQFLPPQFMPPTPAQAAPAPSQAAAALVPAAPVPAPATATATAAPVALTPVEVSATAVPLTPVTPAAPSGASPAAPAVEGVVVHFDFDSAELNTSGRLVLDGWLLQTSKDLPIRLTGHADRLGPEPYNVLLSRRRAEIVKQYLADKGMKAGALRIVAMGEKAPIAQCKGGPTPATKACLAPNRRVEVDPE